MYPDISQSLAADCPRAWEDLISWLRHLSFSQRQGTRKKLLAFNLYDSARMGHVGICLGELAWVGPQQRPLE